MKTTNVRLLLISAAVLMPQISFASVIINEFFYDAQGTDTDQEYVELLNTGSSAVDLTKWKINDGSNHALNVPPKNGGTGSISIPTGGYVLLVDNATNFLTGHSGISGSVVDTVLSLSNTGTTISLVDESGATADSVTYTKDQGANGDGNSLQRSGASWIAASPTPLAPNASAPASPPAQDQSQPPASSSDSSSSSASTNTTVSSYVPPPAAEIFADAGADRTVVVGADTDFRARAYDRKQDLVEKVRFSWNFGDGTTREGAAVMHHFEYPGKYVVVLEIAQDVSAASDRVIVTAEPANLSFTVNSDSSVSITNKAGREIDISHWLVKSFGRSFVFPADSSILPGQTLRISNATLGFPVGPQTELQYPNGIRAEISGESQTAPVVTTSAPVTIKESMPTEKSSESSQEKTQPLKSGEDPVVEANSDTGPASAPPETLESTSSQVAGVGAEHGGFSSWWLGSIAIGLAACGAAFAVKRVKKGEWDIIDESE